MYRNAKDVKIYMRCAQRLYKDALENEGGSS